MAARFRRLTRGFINGRRNRVSSLDNMLEEEKPASAAINRFPSADHLHFTGESYSDAFIRKRAWTEPTDICDEDNKLTEDWMRDWQVGLNCPLEALIMFRFYRPMVMSGSQMPHTGAHTSVEATRPGAGGGKERPLYIRPKCRFFSGNFQCGM